jgi:hypothetical protein
MVVKVARALSPVTLPEPPVVADDIMQRSASSHGASSPAEVFEIVDGQMTSSISSPLSGGSRKEHRRTFSPDYWVPALGLIADPPRPAYSSNDAKLKAGLEDDVDRENCMGIDEDLLSRTLAELHTIQQKLAQCERASEGKSVMIRETNSLLTSALQEVVVLQASVDKYQDSQSKFVNSLSQGIADAVRHMKEFPDCFDEVSEWQHYSDRAAVEQLEEYGAGGFVQLLGGIIDEVHLLTHAHGSTRMVPLLDIDSKRSTIVRMSACLLHSVSPHSFQWVPSWMTAVFVKACSHSTAVVDVVCKMLLGGPGSDIVIHERLVASVEYIRGKGDSRCPQGMDIVYSFDNAPAVPGGYCGKVTSIFHKAISKVVTLVNRHTACDESGLVSKFTQSIDRPENSPSTWAPKYSSTPTTIADVTVAQKKFMYDFYTTQIQKVLNVMVDENYQKGDASKVSAAKPVIRASRKVVDDEVIYSNGRGSRAIPKDIFHKEFVRQSAKCEGGLEDAAATDGREWNCFSDVFGTGMYQRRI